MASTTRWLKWNGVYHHAGLCNRKFADINTDLGVQQRLMVLGFNCGTPDGTPITARNDETKKAIQKFRAYFSPPPEKTQFPVKLKIEEYFYKIKVSVDNTVVKTDSDAPGMYPLPAPLTKGNHKLKIETTNVPSEFPEDAFFKVSVFNGEEIVKIIKTENVFLKPETEFSILIEGGESVVGKIETEASEYKLQISLDGVLIQTVTNASETYDLPEKLSKGSHKLKIETAAAPSGGSAAPALKVVVSGGEKIVKTITTASVFLPPVNEFNFPISAENDEYPDTLDDPMKQKLKELTGGDPVVTPLPAAAPVDLVLSSSRSRRERSDSIGLTINTKSELAVRVESVPEEFHTFTQFPWLKVQITGCERVKSLLLRIYRNFDPARDTGELPFNRLVYQEVLHLEDIRALPLNPAHKKNVALQNPDVAFLLEYNVGYGNGAFLPIGKGNVSWHRVHSPYKVKVWVATDAKAFDQYEKDALTQGLHTEPPAMPSYLFRPAPASPASDDAAPKDDSSATSTDEEDDSSSEAAIEITPDARSLVHDELNKEKGEPQDEGEKKDKEKLTVLSDESDTSEEAAEPKELQRVAPPKELLTNWIKIRQIEAKLLPPPKYWTKKNERGINLIGKPCKEHDHVFHQKNQIRLETFAREFQRKPLEIYLDLRARSLQDHNFHYPELQETFENIERHINLIQQRVCCGEYQWLPDGKKSDIKVVMESLRNEIKALRAANPAQRITKSAWVNDVSPGFPNLDAQKFIAKFTLIFDYLIAKVKFDPELEFHRRNTADYTKRIEAKGEAVTALTYHRNHLVGMEMKLGGYYKYGDDIKAWYKEAGEKLLHNHGKFARSLKEPKVILLPSYNPLNTTFFTRVRQVGMYMLGLIDLPYLMADKLYMCPRDFFDHDNFHIVAMSEGATKQQWGTICDRVAALKDTLGSEEEVFVFWDKNAQLLEREVNTITDKNLQEAVDTLLFALLHEPCEPSTDQAPPAVLEEDSMVARFQAVAKADRVIQEDIYMHDLHEKLTNGFFGHIFPASILSNLDKAKKFIEDKAKLFYTP